jgi:hypothetical protein
LDKESTHESKTKNKITAHAPGYLLFFAWLCAFFTKAPQGKKIWEFFGKRALARQGAGRKFSGVPKKKTISYSDIC